MLPPLQKGLDLQTKYGENRKSINGCRVQRPVIHIQKWGTLNVPNADLVREIEVDVLEFWNLREKDCCHDTAGSMPVANPKKIEAIILAVNLMGVVISL